MGIRLLSKQAPGESVANKPVYHRDLFSRQSRPLLNAFTLIQSGSDHVITLASHNTLGHNISSLLMKTVVPLKRPGTLRDVQSQMPINALTARKSSA